MASRRRRAREVLRARLAETRGIVIARDGAKQLGMHECAFLEKAGDHRQMAREHARRERVGKAALQGAGKEPGRQRAMRAEAAGGMKIIDIGTSSRLASQAS